jgi:hypothetical protein
MPLGFEDLTAVVMNTYIFWDITLCSPLPSGKQSSAYYLFHADFFIGFFDGEDGGDMFLRNVG